MMNSSPTTRVSLILRLRNAADAEAWEEFVSIYHPLIWSIARRLGMSSVDAADACQNTLLRLSQVVHQWNPESEGANFRGWLFRVARHCMIRQFENEKLRTVSSVDHDGQQFLDQLAQDPVKGESRFQLEFQRQLFGIAIELVRPTVKTLYWNAFWMTYVKNQDIKSAAESLDTSVSTIYVARHRVLNRIREEVARLSKSEWGGVLDPSNGNLDSDDESLS